MGWAVSVRSTPLLRPLLAPAAWGSFLGNLFAEETQNKKLILTLLNVFERRFLCSYLTQIKSHIITFNVFL